MTDSPRFGAGRTDDGYAPGSSGSIADLLQNIVGNIQGIIRSEVTLAKTEIKEEATTAGKAASMLAVGAVLGVYAVGLLLLTFIYALNGPLPDWAAALIVFVVVAAVAGVLVKLGLDRIKQVTPM